MTGRDPRLLVATNVQDLIGDGLGTSESLQVDLDLVRGFADLTGDHQWIHVDVERAVEGPYGGPVAHGYLLLALIPQLLWQIVAFGRRVHAEAIALARIRANGVVETTVAQGRTDEADRALLPPTDVMTVTLEPKPVALPTMNPISSSKSNWRVGANSGSWLVGLIWPRGRWIFCPLRITEELRP